jgi:hypothetical protein
VRRPHTGSEPVGFGSLDMPASPWATGAPNDVQQHQMNKRALCIGNAAYPDSQLRNPVDDAKAIAERLKVLGFSCRVLKDGTFRGMHDSLKAFRSDLTDCEVGLVFFAGHGMQIEGENYLTAIDTDFGTEMDAKFSSMPLSKVIEVLEKGANATSILILDACRNNPYERRWRGVGTRGLAPVYAPRGTIIAFATSPGQVAFDGVGSNGAFTSSLLSHIDAQNVTIEDLFKRVRNTLSALTSGKQTSWEHTSLMGDFFFNTAILTGEFTTEYSSQARGDAAFDASGGRFINETIRKLKSYNWYIQNPAIDAITPGVLGDARKDEIFVLGRNIYQCACGGSISATALMSDLSISLKRFDSEVAFHILNGMLYEVYFDSDDRFREKKKTDELDPLLSLHDDERFVLSFEFIRQALLPYQKQLFYVPGSDRDVLIDVKLLSVEEGKVAVQRILVEGQDVFYSNDGTTLVANADAEASYSRSREQFEEELLAEMVVPRKRGRLTYSPVVGPHPQYRSE